MGSDLVVLAFACCGFLPQPMHVMLSPRSETVSEAALESLKGRAMAVELGPVFSEAGMTDPAAEIAGSLAASLAERYGLKFEAGRSPSADGLVLGMQTVEWAVEMGFTDFRVRYRGEATLVDRSNGRKLGRVWCNRHVPAGVHSIEAGGADRPALESALHAAAQSCLQELRQALIAEATPR